jgi:pimeloyl-ACP methyl ester carboxylesterase
VTPVQRIRYIWARLGLALFVLMPVAAYDTFRSRGGPEALQTRGGVTVTIGDEALVFEPAAQRPSGLLFLPGCPVDPAAYASLVRRIAERGYPARIVKVPFPCAAWPSLEAELDRRIRRLAAASPATRWVLAGHSRGGAHAARIASGRPAEIAAYVLIGTSHPRDHDLSGLPVDITKIVASNDGVAGRAQLQKARLPASTHWVRIEGGNHAQFGDYGYQPFDGRATISREAQQSATVVALLEVLSRHSAASPAGNAETKAVSVEHASSAPARTP